MSENKIPQEQAQKELYQFLENMSLSNSPEDREEHEVIVRAIEGGHLIFTDEGLPVFTVRRGKHKGEEVVFNEPTGAHMVSMQKSRDNGDFAQALVLLSEISGRNTQFFRSLVVADINVCSAVVALFTG